MSSRRGWVRIDEQTSVCLRDGQPVRLRTSSENLDRAEERAAHWVGEPLEVGSWEPVGAARPVQDQLYEAECGLAQLQPGNLEWN